MSGKCQVNVKSQSELDIGGRETCLGLIFTGLSSQNLKIAVLFETFSSCAKTFGRRDDHRRVPSQHKNCIII